VVLVAALAVPWSARAHNESVHQRMTDFAYHALLAGARFSAGGEMSERLRVVLGALATEEPGLSSFFADAVVAVPKLRALMSGLPADNAPCVNPSLVGLVGGSLPDWQLPAGTSLDQLRMGQVRFPVTVNYGHGALVCSIDEQWSPSGVLASVNLGSFTTRDHTGVTLGYWSAAPDRETKDWVLRSTTLETLQNPAVVGAIGAGTSVAVSTVCLLACGLFPIACALCPAVGVGAGGVVIDEITSIDADSLESEDYVGFGHFIDMKPTPPPPAVVFDEKPGKLMERAGPTGVPDPTEVLVTALFDLGGVHVNHAESQAPKNYQIALGASGAIGTDFHRNSTQRTSGEWESPTVAHLQLTPVDNLALFGHEDAKAHRNTPLEAKRLGWPLHAIGDASVPMHAVGASGYGHRPYEDCVEAVLDELLGSDDVAASVDAVSEVVQRAFQWRQFIQSWRALHGTNEVPMRDLVTALAALTRQKADAQPAVFQAARSLQYITDEDAATAGYDNAAMAVIQRDLLLEGIAAELSFLMSVTEAP
jgi:hypothetical protein